MAGGFMVYLLRRIGQALFREDDKLARQRGWHIQHGRLGLSRSYRHPGFDALAGCPDCRGSGSHRGAGCGRCAGTGRVALGQCAAPGRR